MIAGLLDGLTLFFLPTHLLSVAALGLLIGQGTRHVPLHLALFALGLLAGSLVIATAVRETLAPLVLLALAAVAGVVILVAWMPPMLLTGALALVVGVAVALNSPPRALTISAAIASQAGTGLAALATLALVAFTAAKAERAWQRIGVRIAGSWIAASAILVLTLRLAR